MKFNETKPKPEDRKTTNYEGGEAYEPATPEMGLYKVVINNLLESKFYTDEEESMDKIDRRLSKILKKNPAFALKLATFARQEMYLREVPQYLLVKITNEKDKYPKEDKINDLVRDYTSEIIRRADELKEVVAIQLELYGQPIPKPLKKGIAEAFHSFDRYQFAKYRNLNREVKFRDVMNLVHPKPETEKEEEIFEKLIKGNLDDYPRIEPLEPPETWEVRISEEGNTKEAWLDILDRMGMFAKLRNLRNMKEVGISGKRIFDEEDLDYIEKAKLYPFRFYQAYLAIKRADVEDKYLVDWLSKAINKSADTLSDNLKNTFVVTDLSGSMSNRLSEKSQMTYKEIGILFASILMRKGADTGAFASDFAVLDSHYRTPTLELMEEFKALDDKIGGCTNGWLPIEYLVEEKKEYDRIIMLTDLQIWDSTSFISPSDETAKEWFDKYRKKINPDVKLYMLDMSSYGDLVTPEGYQGVFNINGWNDKILDFIQYAEHPREIIQKIESKDYTG